MLPEWLEMRDMLVRSMSEHRALCQAATPDPVALSRSRWLLSNASRQRASWLVHTVNPVAERLAHTPGGAAWLAFQVTATDYRQGISAFLSRWPIEATVADWAGYRRDVVALRGTIAPRLRQEEFAIRALAAALEAQGDIPAVVTRQA